ncbi:ABC transporter permease [Bacillus cereus]|uniref:ABC transporter permease n=1 Tax=Bacillus cereus TaxID=1396 RepID=UPI002AC28C84|nr:ABC transporter permease [Bacillus cereus]MDZ4588740.1 ABC transporter permease [Bacillus cereus]MDZ4599587.1 ABC transporter permease [Bacillus cereus]
MNKFWTIFKFTYLKKILSKSFIFVSLIFIIGIIGIMNIDKIEKFFLDYEKKSIAIVTSDNNIYSTIEENMPYINPDASFKKTTKNEAYKLLESNNISHIYLIDSNPNNTLNAKVIYNDSIEQVEKDRLQQLLSQIQFTNKSIEYKLTPEEINDLRSPSNVVTEKFTNSDEPNNSKESELIKSIAYISIFIMFIITLNYSNQAALEIATEKNSKVMEMIITSVSPIVHLWGKILALIASALTQVLIITITIVTCYFVFDGKSLFENLNFEINEDVIGVFILSLIYIFIGLTTFIILAMIIGSMTTNLENISQAVMPINILLFIPVYLIIFNIDSPEDSLVKITSFIPFFSPFTMMLRITTPEVSIYEILISIAFSILVIILLSWFASRSYKTSLLSFDTNFIQSIKKIILKN